MAVAGIPPVGQMHRDEVNRQMRNLEQTTPDPVLRWKLRDQRLHDGMVYASNAAVRKAEANQITYNMIKGVK